MKLIDRMSQENRQKVEDFEVEYKYLGRALKKDLEQISWQDLSFRSVVELQRLGMMKQIDVLEVDKIFNVTA